MIAPCAPEPALLKPITDIVIDSNAGNDSSSWLDRDQLAVENKRQAPALLHRSSVARFGVGRYEHDQTTRSVAEQGCCSEQAWDSSSVIEYRIFATILDALFAFQTSPLTCISSPAIGVATQDGVSGQRRGVLLAEGAAMQDR